MAAIERSFTDRLKTWRRELRTVLVRGVVALIRRQPATAVPRLRRLLRPALTTVFAREIARARANVPREFAANADAVVAGMIDNQVTHLLEVFLFESLARHHGPERFIRVHGRPHLDAALAAGRGAIILAAHFGGWELIGYWLATNGYPIHALARPQAVDSMTRFMNGFREERGVQVLMSDSLAAAGRVLSGGALVGLLADLDAKEHGLPAQFFGQAASFYPSPVLLSMRYRAPLLPTFIERTRDGTHELRFEEPVRWEAGETLPERVQKYASRYEAAIRRRPDHWVWFHQRYVGVTRLHAPTAGANDRSESA